MTNYNDFEKSLQNLSDIFIRLDKKQLINQLRALQDNYIELWINSKNLKSIILRDRYNINRIITKN